MDYTSWLMDFNSYIDRHTMTENAGTTAKGSLADGDGKEFWR